MPRPTTESLPAMDGVEFSRSSFVIAISASFNKHLAHIPRQMKDNPATIEIQ
jgi:hypothetical protein